MNMSVLERCRAFEASGMRSPLNPIVLERAQGAYLFDNEGRRYLDLSGLFAVASVGHNHPAVVDAVIQQARDLMHCPSANPSRVRAEFYEAVASIAPKELNRILPAITGAMANETAIRIAKTRRPQGEVITFSGSYFGRSPGIVGLAGKANYRESLGIQAAGQFLPYPATGETGFRSSNNVIETLNSLAGPAGGIGEIAAVIVEPVQGNGGVVIPPSDFLPRLRAFCDQTGALLIIDEIQSGCGRSGKMWASQHFNVVPDLMTIGKGIGGGMAVAAIVGKSEYMTSWRPDSYSSTFLTNNVNLAAAVAAIRVMQNEDLAARSERLGAKALKKLQQHLQNLPSVEEVRGIGLWVAIDFGLSSEGARIASLVLQGLQQKGIIAGGGGYAGQVVKIAPPLTIEEADLEEGLDTMISVVRDIICAPQQEYA
ncbi:aspartate aminotransferase family protein [Aminobacter sp. J44]|uniref:aspartate aminotransferase family protein n=1 Tax=Aminobacter sp. J44 TaxID=935262 RepID=UPI00119C8F77|nr:aspartate aminotransferase family protein [Aminobacter sp. J44]TWG53212.1 4-aminobutyrate aminotransferase/4-aminobutyrate aminotransferase/(S)-3-amino-2-methylpropionate transaminase [Aminobacter sp. J44]